MGGQGQGLRLSGHRDSRSHGAEPSLGPSGRTDESEDGGQPSKAIPGAGGWGRRGHGTPRLSQGPQSILTIFVAFTSCSL